MVNVAFKFVKPFPELVTIITMEKYSLNPLKNFLIIQLTKFFLIQLENLFQYFLINTIWVNQTA